MNNTNTGGPAFPHTVEYKGSECGGVVPHGGMTLRDYFAAKAMQSICNVWPRITPESTAKTAYEFADAMLREREAK
jgi:hypothetical protein